MAASPSQGRPTPNGKPHRSKHLLRVAESFCNEVRLEIIAALAVQPLNVTQLATILQYEKSVVSKQLRSLRSLDLVRETIESRSHVQHLSERVSGRLEDSGVTIEVSFDSFDAIRLSKLLHPSTIRAIREQTIHL